MSSVPAAEAAGFEVRDIESLREHYALTLKHWLQRFEAAQGDLQKLTDEVSCRVFLLYLAGTAYEFQCGRVNLHQSLLVKSNGGQSGVPLTRHDWYRSDDLPAGMRLRNGNYATDGAGGDLRSSG